MAYDADECAQALPVVDALKRASLRESLACEATVAPVMLNPKGASPRSLLSVIQTFDRPSPQDHFYKWEKLQFDAALV